MLSFFCYISGAIHSFENEVYERKRECATFVTFIWRFGGFSFALEHIYIDWPVSAALGFYSVYA